MTPRRTLAPAAPYRRWTDFGHGLRALLRAEGEEQVLEREVESWLGVRRAFAVSSGKAALVLILRALRALSPRREVVLPAYTCFAVVAAVREAGLTIRPCDIDRSTLGLDPREVGKAVTGDTLCVVPTHHFGIPADVAGIRREIAGRVPFVVENAAQALGERIQGRHLGTLGDVALFSLGRGKAISAGNGGLVVTDSPEIEAALDWEYRALPGSGVLESWREYATALATQLLIHPALYWFPAGLPFLRLGETILPDHVTVTRLSRAGRGLAREWKRRVEEGNDHRARIGAHYSRRLGLDWGKGEELPYLRFPILVNDPGVRQRILGRSHERGLGIAPMYPVSIDALEGVPRSPGGCPRAADVARSLLTLPTHHFVTDRDSEAIVAALQSSGWPAIVGTPRPC